MEANRDAQAVSFFQELLRVRSTSHLGPSSGSYVAAVAVLEREAKVPDGADASTRC